MNLLKKSLLYLFFLIYLINLLFSGGWDIWTQTLTFLGLLTVLILILLFYRDFRISESTVLVIIVSLFYLISNKFSCIPVISNYYLFSFLSSMTVVIIMPFLVTEYDHLLKRLVPIAIIVPIIDIVLKILLGINLFPNPNIKTGILILFLPFILEYGINQHRKKSMSPGIIIGYIAILISLLLSKSQLGMMIFFSMLILYFTEKKYLIYIISIISGLALAIISLKPAEMIFNRIDWMVAGIKMIIKQPFFGFGPDSSAHILTDYLKAEPYSIYIHSYFIQFGAEIGLIALLFLILLIISLIKNIDASYKKPVYFSVLGLLVYNLFEYNLNIPAISITFWIICSGFRKNEKKVWKLSKVNLFIILICIIPAFIYIPKPFISSRYFSKAIYSLNNGEIAESKSLMDKAYRITPGYKLIHLGYSIIDYKNRNLKNAISNLSKSLPNNHGALIYRILLLSEMHLKNSRPILAENEYKRAVTVRLFQFGLNPDDYLK